MLPAAPFEGSEMRESDSEGEIVERVRPEPASLDARVGALVEAKVELELARKAKARAVWDAREAVYGGRAEIADALAALERSYGRARAAMTRPEIGYAAAQSARPRFEREVLQDVLEREDRAARREQEQER